MLVFLFLRSQNLSRNILAVISQDKYPIKRSNMETEFCIMCEGELEGEEKLTGFCIHCELNMTQDIAKELNENIQRSM